MGSYKLLNNLREEGVIVNLPKKVKIVEVGPRDGFQNVKDFIETKDKIEIIKKMVDAGAKHIEITSFVHPKWVPQMKDAKEVLEEVKDCIGDREVELIALVPNKYGALKAKEAGAHTITYVISASEAHNKANVNRTIEESFKELEDIQKELGDVKFRLALATTFGCPFNEKVPTSRIIEMAKRGLSMGADKILLADTIGSASPLKVKNIISEITKEMSPEHFVTHFHDTRGMGLANTLVALNENITYFESAVGGLGGCPFAPGAAGNIATEDLVNMLHSMSIETDIDLNKTGEVIDLIREKVKSPIVSHMASLCKEQ